MYSKFVNVKEILIVSICMYKWNFIYIYFYLLIFIYDRHVQINNETALSFYKKFGFQIISTATEYYRRLEPCDAFLLERSLKKTPLTEQATSPSVQQSSKKVPAVPLSTITDVD
jgi:hypothetical protein